MMKKILSMISLGLLSSCFTQQPLEVIDQSEIILLNTIDTQKKCLSEIVIYTNQDEFNKFQSTIPKTHPRSGPVIQVDFTNKNIATVCKADIDSYSVDSILVYKNHNVLSINAIPNYQNNSDFHPNLIVLEIPKKITQLK